MGLHNKDYKNFGVYIRILGNYHILCDRGAGIKRSPRKMTLKLIDPALHFLPDATHMEDPAPLPDPRDVVVSNSEKLSENRYKAAVHKQDIERTMIVLTSARTN